MGSPACNITSSVGVGIRSVSATNTQKLRLSRTIGFVDTTAQRAKTRCVARVYRTHPHSRQLCFVFDKASQLVERPTMQSSTLTTPNRGSITNTAKFFEGDTLIECLRSRYYALGDYVVCVPGKVPFLSTPLPEQSFGGGCDLALQLRPQPSVPVPDTLDHRAGVDIALAVNGDVDNAQVHPKPALPFFGSALRFGRWRSRGLWSVDGSTQVELTVPHHKVGFSLLRQEQATGAFIRQVGDALSTRKGGERYFRTSLIPTEDTNVISNRAMLAERALGLLIQLISISDLSNHPHHYLSGKHELISHAIVQHFVQSVLGEGAVLPGPLTDKVGSIVGSFNRFYERADLLWGGLQLDGSSQLHTPIRPLASILDKKGERDASSPCPQLWGGSVPNSR
jgi:hypothetical protein